MLLLISDDDIQYAEKILFGKVDVFDDERKAFIKYLDTCDLQAVPGSGKTTALLAKLLILERYLPFDDGSGVLVISHTNAAINEIKNKIEKFCPKLFSYPNFVGTIQSFVDEFLAKPFYLTCFKKRIVRIDNDSFEENASKFSRVFFKGFKSQEQNNAKSLLRVFDTYKYLRFSRVAGVIELTYRNNSEPLNVKKPRGNTKKENYTDWTNEEKGRVKEWLIKFRKKLFFDGYLCFDDTYYLAFEYLFRFPKIKELLEMRFKYALVDEMQDMDKHQHEILEKLFWNDGKCKSKYQRIGDKNQSIYIIESAFEEVWTEREATLEFNGSYRLHPKVAKVVERLALRPISVIGRCKNTDGTEIDIKTHVLVYDDNTIQNVIPKFVEVTKSLLDSGKLPADFKHSVKAICWNTQPDDPKIRIGSYFPQFAKDEQKLSVNYPCLDAYLHEFDKTKKSLATIRKNILNSLIRVLRLEGISEIEGLPITKRRLLSFLQENHNNEFEELKLKIYCWCMQVVKGQSNIVFEELKLYVIKYLACFGKTISESISFIDEPYHPLVAAVGAPANPFSLANVFSKDGITVEIGTVHSVKGQTHTATLYLESFYQKAVQGLGNYESERLASQLKGNPLPHDAHEFIKQSMKMTYVGFSRPTHLLCFAVHKNRYDANLSDLGNDWEIVYV